jgi:hypothetical protein
MLKEEEEEGGGGEGVEIVCLIAYISALIIEVLQWPSVK